MTIDTRPVLVGMNNPYGIDLKYALYPLPRHATGHRIYEMLWQAVPEDISMSSYAHAFDRRNLQTGPWVQGAARVCAMALRPELRGRTVVLFGTKVRDAFLAKSLATVHLCGSVALEHLEHESSTSPSFTYLHWVPHPSGLNQWYNNPDNRQRVGKLLARLYQGERGLLSF